MISTYNGYTENNIMIIKQKVVEGHCCRERKYEVHLS